MNDDEGVGGSAVDRERLFAALEAEPGSAYLLGRDLSLQYVNEAWKRFARDNGAPGLSSAWNTGQPITWHFQSPLRESFTLKFQRALLHNEPFHLSYECSSANVYRQFSMRLRPTPAQDGLIVIHSLLTEARLPREAAERAALGARYTDARGIIVQCSACGRVRLPETASWHWAPGLGTQRPNLSHGICPTCHFQYYG